MILETSFLSFFKGAPVFADVIAFMGARGFCAYDLFALSHRPLDGALAQADVVFVPEDSPLRRHRHYANPAQRQALNQRFSP